MSQKNTKACIVIPVYKDISDSNEILSLKQGLTIFHSHPIIFICPKSLDTQLFATYTNLHPNVSFETFDDTFFRSTHSYNILLLSSHFYQRFINYDFMLIYQPDAYVFEDHLHKWCNKGLDYVGAPWFKKFDTSGKEKEFIENAGNGGFSLRNIQKINYLMTTKLSLFQMIKLRKILVKSRKEVRFTYGFFANYFRKSQSFSSIVSYICDNDIPPNEDYFIATTFPKLFPEFVVAKANQAVAFSFEAQPENLYKLNNKTLPFGCHGFAKYSPTFWKEFINLTD